MYKRKEKSEKKFSRCWCFVTNDLYRILAESILFILVIGVERTTERFTLKTLGGRW